MYTGQSGERANRGLVSVDTERESSLKSQSMHALKKKKKESGKLLDSLMGLLDLLECRLVVLVAYCWSSVFASLSLKSVQESRYMRIVGVSLGSWREQSNMWLNPWLHS